MPRIWVASGMSRLLGAHGGLAAQLRGPVLNRLDDIHVASAAAQVAGYPTADLVLRWTWIRLEERVGHHQHARRAEPTLESVFLPETFLECVELAALLQAFYRLNAGPVGLNGQHRTGLHCHSVEDDRTRTAVRRITTDVRAGEVEVLSEEVHQQESRLNLAGMLLTIHVDADTRATHRLQRAHAAPPCARVTARRSARRVSSRTIARL